MSLFRFIDTIADNKDTGKKSQFLLVKYSSFIVTVKG